MTHASLRNSTANVSDSAAARCLIGSGAAVAACSRHWRRSGVGSVGKASVFIAGGQRYDGGLERNDPRRPGWRRGFEPTSIRGKRVLLKPNLVEPTKKVAAHDDAPGDGRRRRRKSSAAGAPTVIVGEGPGHVRDTELALLESRHARGARRRRAWPSPT